MNLFRATILTVILPVAMLHAEPSPDNLAAAKRLVELINVKEQMDAGFSAMMPMIDQLAAKLQLDASGKAELILLYKDWFRKDLDQEKLLNNITNVYATTFTTQELDGLCAFYQTDLGRKTLKALPEIMQRSAQLGMEEAKAKEDLLKSRLNAFIADKHGAKK